MRIAQVAPLIESVPPAKYGGTERVVHYLTEALVRAGHRVTLFASGNSRTNARLLATVPQALRLASGVRDASPHHVLQIEHVRRMADEFDIVHFHTEPWHFSLARQLGRRAVTTLHGSLETSDMTPCYREFAELAYVSISDAQRAPQPDLNWVGTVLHGSASESDAPGSDDGYLVFLGRIAPEKRPDRAIEIARRAGRTLRIAAKVDAADLVYFRNHIEPLIDDETIIYHGELDETRKFELLRNARALLFPIDWPEPFGLVMIEAMAAGTPVIAWRNGSVPEVIEPGVTGEIVDSIDAAVAAVERVARLDRNLIRLRYEERFSAERMARDYLAIYHRLTRAGRASESRTA